MRSRRTVLVSISVLVVALLVAAAVYFTRSGADDSTPTGEGTSASPSPSPSTTAPEAEPTTAPPATSAPTAAPTTAAPEVPDVEVPEPTPDPTATAAPGGEVTVLITYAGATGAGDVEVGAYAATVEDGGTCTLTLTQGTAERSATNAAMIDVGTTGCGQLLIPASDLPSGTWTAVVDYQSAASHGQSSPREVVVP